jgi:hypothetical protein
VLKYIIAAVRIINKDVMASMMLTYFWLKFIDTPLLTMYVVVCIQTSNIDIFDPDG